MTKQTMFNRSEVVAWLGRNGYSELRDQVDSMTPIMSIKGDRFSDVVLSFEVQILIGSELHRKLECDVTSIIIDSDQLYTWK